MPMLPLVDVRVCSQCMSTIGTMLGYADYDLHLLDDVIAEVVARKTIQPRR